MTISQQIQVSAERQSLQDRFKLITPQKFNTSFNIPLEDFSKIEKVLNKVCEDKECFFIKADVVITPNLQYFSTFVKQMFSIEIKLIVNYDNVIISSDTIKID